LSVPLTVPNLLLWMLVVGVIGFVAMGVDKALARSNWGERISERTLWLTALAGGCLGVVLAALAFHHKTSKAEFWPPVLLALALWALLLALVSWGRFP
jgi:uncharacterized membrane protein YsdA (DUF1294 family)